MRRRVSKTQRAVLHFLRVGGTIQAISVDGGVVTYWNSSDEQVHWRTIESLLGRGLVRIDDCGDLVLTDETH